MTTESPRLRFGIYPGGAAGDDRGGLATGPPDDPERIVAALRRLQGPARHPLLVRAYTSFRDDTDDADDPGISTTPADALRLVGEGRRLDLVVQFQSRRGDVDGYAAHLRRIVATYGDALATLQVTEEPNVAGNPNLDGDYPGVREALVAGVLAARDEARRRGLARLQVGFNTTVLFGPATTFAVEVVDLGGVAFVAALDYVGLDLFPDVFHPVPLRDLAEATAGLLSHHRREVLAPAGLGHLPLHITEHGWPTGPDRSPATQAAVVETVVAAAAATPGVDRYMHF
ncbi:MAG TPA: hypothetical protein VIL48_18125, partial [Acidimicrobiales bacterium]